MPNEIRTKLDAEAAFTITLASLAASSGRASAGVSNANSRPAALIFLRLQTGGVAPTAGTVYEVYLLRRDTTATIIGTDGWGGTDAAITILNASMLGTIVLTANTNTNFTFDGDTAPLGPLGPEWGIAVRNGSNQAMNNTEGNHLKRYITYLPEIQ